MKEPPHPCLAQGKARYVGDHVAVVIAETRQQARDAAELVKVDYEELPAVVRAGEARKKGAPVVHDIAPDNTCYVWGLGDKAAVDKAFSGRDHVTKAELALDKDGKFLAMRVTTTANMGAYLSTFASCIPTILYATLLAGQYTTPVIYAEVTAVFTNTAPVDAYRGAGRPEATYVVERLVETAAREMKMNPAEIRRRNFIKNFPYQTPVALLYDTGNYEATLAEALKVADVAGFPGRKADAAKRGKLRGLGYCCYIEACGIAPSNVAGALGARAGLFEAGEVRVHPTGKVTVFTGSHAHGPGHETTFPQRVADRLRIPMEDVDHLD